ncbi:antibiotic biosynthesis monooxygenase [Methylobacterium variabile]|jgi:heme-degrading monooxygenase HmoA|uniref:Antibiotic biosynthesis monooxygenase n=1 Tax=Methylobacterium variabile TaxID=298794 RepID=A0A0J6VI38_9HYPH|nr:antibiotic biosynthesis monooxygenase family protein [Methylobacterium variabile]KMO38761.1 antibiotic biosynthesis monooxygenase [Methylobacterium variabile]
MSDVVLINPFEVAPGDEAAAVAYWERAADHLRRQPGFVATTLHQAVAPGPRFPLVNVATWRSAEDFLAATGDSAFRALVGPEMGRFPHHPGLYKVIRT